MHRSYRLYEPEMRPPLTGINVALRFWLLDENCMRVGLQRFTGKESSWLTVWVQKVAKHIECIACMKHRNGQCAPLYLYCKVPHLTFGQSFPFSIHVEVHTNTVPQSSVSHMILKCRLSLWEQNTHSTHVHNKAVEGLSLSPPCSTELSPICPSLNICCGNAAGAGGLPPPIWRGE